MAQFAPLGSRQGMLAGSCSMAEVEVDMGGIAALADELVASEWAGPFNLLKA